MAQGGKRTAYLLFCIAIKKAKASPEPATSREISKKRSKTRKATSREERKKHDETAKHKTKRPKERTSGPPRGARKRQRRRQRRRVSFSRAKQPLPAFFLFMAQHRPQLQRSNPHWTAVETVKKLGKMWHKQPEKDKEMYKEQAAQLRRRRKKRRAKVRA